MADKAPKKPNAGEKTAKASTDPKDENKGTPAAKTVKTAKPLALLDADNPPAGLGPSGLALWRDLHLELGDGWGYDSRELQALESACWLYDRFDQLNEAVDKHGVTVEGSTGQLVVNPALPELRHTAHAIAKLLGELGLPNEAGVPETAATKRGRRAAEARWSRAENWSRQALEHRRRKRGPSH